MVNSQAEAPTVAYVEMGDPSAADYAQGDESASQGPVGKGESNGKISVLDNEEEHGSSLDSKSNAYKIVELTRYNSIGGYLVRSRQLLRIIAIAPRRINELLPQIFP